MRKTRAAHIAPSTERRAETGGRLAKAGFTLTVHVGTRLFTKLFPDVTMFTGRCALQSQRARSSVTGHAAGRQLDRN